MAHHLTARLKNLAGILLWVGLTACADQEPPEPDGSSDAPAASNLTPPPQPVPETAGPSEGSEWAAATLSNCYAWLQRFRTNTNALARQAQNFSQEPGEDGLMQLQSRWRDALRDWGGATLCLSAPLPDASGQQMRDRLAVTAAGPALPGYLDRLPAYPNSGLIMDETVTISLESLMRQHQITDDSEVSLGLYALEIILFGPAGDRRWSDFTRSLPETDFQPAARRARVLTLLSEHLAGTAEEWLAYMERGMARQEAGQMPDAMSSILAIFDRRVALAADESLALSRGRPGVALQPEHDRLVLQGLVSHLSDWWALPLTRTAVLDSGISEERWNDVMSIVRSANNNGVPSHQDMQQITAMLLRLRNQRTVTDGSGSSGPSGADVQAGRDAPAD